MAIAPTKRGETLKSHLERKFIRGDGNLGITVVADIERARYLTESFKQTEGKPWVIRRALAFEHYLKNKTIFIMPDELLMVHVGKDLRSLPFYPDFYTKPILYQCMASKFALTPEEWAELEEIAEYWKGKCSEDKIVAQFTDEIMDNVYSDPANPFAWRGVYTTLYRYSGNSPGADLPFLWENGLDGIQAKIRESMKKYDPAECEDPSKVKDYMDRYTELKAMLIASDAMRMYCQRHIDMALEAAEKETDPQRKKELLEMAKSMDISTPTEHFQKALQLMWLEHSTSRSQEMQAAGSPHRFDYLLYPYYKKDIESGYITEEYARELMEDMWLKYERVMGCLVPAQTRSNAVGSNMLFQHFTLGGIDPDTGRDITNDLSYLALDTSMALKTVQPALSIRVHPGTPDKLLAKCWECLKEGSGGNPSFFGDRPVIEHLLNMGVSLHDARNNCVAGCVAVCIEGLDILDQLKVNGSLNCPFLFSAALNHGKDVLTGEQVGVDCGDPNDMTTYKDLEKAFLAQVHKIFYWGHKAGLIARNIDSEHNKLPWQSCLHPRCIERGVDARDIEGCDYSYPFFGCVSGIVDVADAIRAIQDVVFDKKLVTMQEMADICANNWEGREDLRQACLDAPKFGDGEDLVADILNDLYEGIGAEAASFTDATGQKYDAQYHSVSTFDSYGKMTPAIPNGRRHYDPLYDGGISPLAGHGKDPVTVLEQVAKIDATKTQRILHNMRLSTNTTPKQFIQLMHTWADMNLSQIQFNVVDSEVLYDAKENPDNYEDLLVRVAGFSAVYINLAPHVQDTIIARTELEV